VTWHVTGQKPGNETEEHFRAKTEAFAWLWRRGYRRIAFECRVAGHIVDVVGWSESRIALVEAKGHRSDFLSELRKRRQLEQAAADLSALEDTRAATTPGPERRALAKRLQALRSAVFQPTGPRRIPKLDDPLLIACSSERYLCAPAGVILPGELPEAWGLIWGTIKTRCSSPGLDFQIAGLIRSLDGQAIKRSTWHVLTQLPIRWHSGRPMGARGASTASPDDPCPSGAAGADDAADESSAGLLGRCEEHPAMAGEEDRDG